MRRIPPLSTALLFACLLSSVAWAQDAPSEETIEFFRLNCTSCHTIGGGRLVGPDLKDVEQRQERAWLVGFISDPAGVIDSGDPYAAELVREARGQRMLPIVGMTKERAGKLLDLIAAESLLEESQFKGTQISDRPLTPADEILGERLFRGQQKLAGGGPACTSCHTVNGLWGLGGGRLGPDLSAVYSRLEGRKALGAWLVMPPGVTMQPLFRKHPLDAEEILPLVAFLKKTAESGEGDARSQVLDFVVLGIGLAAGLMVLLDVLWRRRFRAVRRPLVAQS